jgi:hypothetical protein
MPSPEALLDTWLASRTEADLLDWFRAKVVGATKDGADSSFFLAFSTLSRKVGRSPLALSDVEKALAEGARAGWKPGSWTIDQAARTRLVLALPVEDEAGYRLSLDRLFEDADHGELVTLYQALPLLPHPSFHRARAREGIRSNMKTVFEAVALRNPYPAEMLDEAAWNQLVLKCLFVGSTLLFVDGLDERANRTLARMLSDYAHERWAAGRSVSPELWRSIGPIADEAFLPELERVLATGTDVERAGVSLAARHNPNLAPLLLAHSRVVDRALAEYPTWEAVVAAIPP